MPGFQSWADDKRIKYLVVLVLVLAAVALASYSYYTYRQTEFMNPQMRQISVSGKGEVLAKADIASFTFSANAEGATAGEAQEKSATALNAVVDYLKGAGIEEKDIKTIYYSLDQKYKTVPVEGSRAITPCGPWGCEPSYGEQVPDGYTVTQTIQVKVRDTAKSGEIVAGVGTKGATNISSLEFTIDDDEALKREAREKAIADAKANAEKLADALGVRLGDVVSYNEDGGYMPYLAKGAMMEMAADSSAGTAPAMPMGENTITSNVTLMFEIR